MDTKMKPCKDCGKTLPLSEFYAHPRMADGHLNKCKECAKKHVRDNRKEKIEYYRDYDKKRAMIPKRINMRALYQSTDAGRAAMDRSRGKYIKNNPIKRVAHNAVNNAVRDGILKKLPCQVCGSTKRIHGHHDDYSRPLDVVWLCPKHHREEHVRKSLEAETCVK